MLALITILALLQTPPIHPACYFVAVNDPCNPNLAIEVQDATGQIMSTGDCCTDGMTLNLVFNDDGLGTEWQWRVVDASSGDDIGHGVVTVTPQLGFAEVRMPIPKDCDGFFWVVEIEDSAGVSMGCRSFFECFKSECGG